MPPPRFALRPANRAALFALAALVCLAPLRDVRAQGTPDDAGAKAGGPSPASSSTSPSAPASAAPVGVGDPNAPFYPYVVINQGVGEILRNYAERLGLGLDVTGRPTGTVQGPIRAATDEAFLREVGRQAAVDVFTYEGTLYASPLSRRETRTVSGDVGSQERLDAALARIGLPPGRFPVRFDREAKITVISGPPRFVELAFDVASRLNIEDRFESPLERIRARREAQARRERAGTGAPVTVFRGSSGNTVSPPLAVPRPQSAQDEAEADAPLDE